MSAEPRTAGAERELGGQPCGKGRRWLRPDAVWNREAAQAPASTRLHRHGNMGPLRSCRAKHPPIFLGRPATSPPFARHPWWGRLPLTRRAGSGRARAELRWAGVATPEGTQRGRPGLRAQALDGGKAVPFISVSREKSRIGTELRDQGRERRRGPGLCAVAHTGLVSRGTRSAAAKGSCLLLRPQATAFPN